jgi:hypothetical protein
MADGSVHSLSCDLDVKLHRAMASIDGGDVVYAGLSNTYATGMVAFDSGWLLTAFRPEGLL